MRLLALALTVMPVPALALSCLPHGVTDAYIQADEATEAYIPVHGDLTFDEALLPQVDWEKQQDTPAETLVPATFKGKALSARGVGIPFEADVVLELRCFGPWCPSPTSGDALVFLRKTAHSYVASTNACGGFVFSQPTKAQLDAVQDCLSGRACEPLSPR